MIASSRPRTRFLCRSIAATIVLLAIVLLAGCGESSSAPHGGGGGSPGDVVHPGCAPQPCATQNGVTITIQHEERSYEEPDGTQLVPGTKFFLYLGGISVSDTAAAGPFYVKGAPASTMFILNAMNQVKAPTDEQGHNCWFGDVSLVPGGHWTAPSGLCFVVDGPCTRTIHLWLSSNEFEASNPPLVDVPLSPVPCKAHTSISYDS